MRKKNLEHFLPEGTYQEMVEDRDLDMQHFLNNLPKEIKKDYLDSFLHFTKKQIKEITSENKDDSYKNALEKIKCTLEQIYLEKETTHKEYYNLMKVIIENPINMKCTQKCLGNIPSLLNAKKEGNHILSEIVDQFISNIKREVTNQRGLPYDESAYFKQIFFLFLDEPALLLENSACISKQLEAFKNEIISAKDSSPLSKKGSTISSHIDEMKVGLERYNIRREKLNILDVFIERSKRIGTDVILYEDRRKAKVDLLMEFYTYIPDLFHYQKQVETIEEEKTVTKVEDIPFIYTDKEREVMYKKLDTLAQTFEEYINADPIITSAKESFYDADILEKAKEHRKDAKTAMQNLISQTPYIIEGTDRVHLDKEYLENLKNYIFAIQEDRCRKTGQYIKYEEIKREFAIDSFEMNSALSYSSTVSFGNKNLCFSIVHGQKGAVFLRMHHMDIASYLKDNAFMEEEVRQAQIEGRPSPLENLEIFSFKKDQKAPAITYQVRVHKDGRCGNLKIYKSIVSLDKTYENNGESDALLNRFINVYKGINDSFITEKIDMEEDLEQMFLRKTKEYMQYHHQPAILSLYSGEDEKRYMDSHYTRCELYSKIKREEASTLYQIFKEASCHHYTNDAKETSANLESMCKPNYITYLNQLLLFTPPEIVIDERGKETYAHPKQTQMLSDQCVMNLNQKMGYIDANQLHHSQKQYVRK
ncbi:MAG: hypothetical protein PHN72_06205 [Bacilli bacterium]|nr:hypothetical protein [Bacilli bacterium]